jgi:hypothetical protein
MVPVREDRQRRAAGCSTVARRPPWRTRRTARSRGHSGREAAGTRPARRSCVPPSSDGDPTGSRSRPAPGDADLAAPPRQLAATAAMIVGLVGVDLLEATTTPAGLGAHRREVAQQRLGHQAVVGVGPGHQQRQRQPAALSGQVQLGSGLGPVDRICATQVPLVARRLQEFTLTRDQSSAPAWPSSSSRTSWSRSSTWRGPTRRTAASMWSPSHSRTRLPAAAPKGWRYGP